MPRSGRFGKLDARLPEERRALATALRDLMAVIGLTLRDTHEALHERGHGCDTTRSALSDLLNARVLRPKREVVRAIYDLAESAARANGIGMPLGWKDLEDLRVKAGALPARICVSCQASVLPVPPGQGDRQYAHEQWPAMAHLVELKHTRKAEDVAGVLRHVGLTGRPDEVADAVTACRAGGLSPEADVILQYVRDGRDSREQASIAYEFMQVGDNVTARTVLGMSLSASGISRLAGR
ncbi:hypothetical protein [Streptomyces sp. NPDC094468]|uniref:hypothetical protein n=1 Tax=Streptomyces sp. NPDC094468 TaxID=3366066 RepID=UPI00382DA78C